MPANDGFVRLMKSKYAIAAMLALALQAAGFYAIQRQEVVPLARSFSEFPFALGDWRMLQQGTVDPETMEVLKADDVLTRTYYEPASGRGANLFVAFFQSQRTGRAPHSPKNCLPGSGWAPLASEIVSLRIAGLEQPVEVNRYVVSKGEARSLVLYWYQSHGRSVASEYKARAYTIVDAIRYNRTDTAMVRVVVPVMAGGVEQAAKTAEDFVAAFFGPLRAYLPS
jgi:EpsI family protein